jgi:hypothetical protein
MDLNMHAKYHQKFIGKQKKSIEQRIKLKDEVDK